MPRAIHHLLILGAAGQMTQVAARAICAAHPALQVTLADRDLAGLERVAKGCGSAQVAIRKVDLFDDEALRQALATVDFVILGAGPFYKTAERVMQACVAARVSYMDIDDDVESTLRALELDGRAREAGVTLYVGHGASPGLSNVLALDLLQRLEKAEELEVAWCVGDDPHARLGRAVAEHTLHIGAGEYTGFHEGRRAQRESYGADAVFPLAEPLGNYRLYECAHPEPVMFGFTHPELRSVICWGGLHPQPLNGALRGLALAVREGRLGLDEACDLLLAASPDNAAARAGAARPSASRQARAAGHALVGMVRQLGAGRASLRDFGPVLARRGARRAAALVGIGARARGMRAGRACELLARVHVSVPPTGGGAMAAITGACEASFFQQAMAGDTASPGVAFPQAWVRPQEFYAALARQLSAVGGSFRVSVDEG